MHHLHHKSSSSTISADEIAVSEGTPTTVFVLPTQHVEPIISQDGTIVSTSTTSSTDSSSTSHVEPIVPVREPLATQEKRDGLNAELADDAAAPSPLPPISTRRDRLLLLWRLADASVIWIRPLLIPLVAWGLGFLHFNIVFALALAWLWFFSAKNGHLLPRPPPTAQQQLQRAEDKKDADQLLPTSPVSPASPPPFNPDMVPVTFQMSGTEGGTAPSHFGLMSLPGMLSGLTVQYPDWFFYPDVQRTKWINDALEILWPYAKAAVRGEIDKRVEPLLAMTRGIISIVDLDFGPDAPFVGGIKVYDTKDDDTVMLDIDIRLAIEPNIRIQASWWKLTLPVCVTAVSAALTARVTLTGLIGRFPCFRRLGIALASKPDVMTTVDVLGINFFDVPIIGSYAQHLVEDIAMKMFGWPKELSIPIMVETAEEMAARNKLEPKGLLHVYLMSASNLRNADAVIGKSDPYCKVTVGDQMQTSAVVRDTLNPTWNADFEFICYEPERDVLKLAIFDLDVMRVPNPLNSKRLGDVDYPISNLLPQPFQDVTMPLQHTTKGSVRFQCEWRPFAVRSAHVHRHHHGAAVAAESNSASNSVLFVSSLRAIDLPLDNAFLKFTLGNVKKKTQVRRARARECEWEERFSFAVFNPEVEQLTVQLRYDSNAAKLTGFATKHVTLGMKEMKTKSSLLSQLTIDVREVARTGHLSNDFLLPLPPGMKVVGKPRLHMTCMLRELEASVSAKERKMQAGRCALPGTLTVVLISAHGLVGVDHGGRSDPYVVLTVGTQQVKSGVKKRTCDPVWKETYTFRISDLMRDDLQLDCRDWGSLSAIPGVGGMMEGFMHKVTMKNDHLGDCHVPLRLLYAQLHGGGMVEKELPLNHAKQGHVKLSLQFVPDSGVVMPPPESISQISMPDLLRLGSQSSLSTLGSLSSLGSSSTLFPPSIAEEAAIASTTTDGRPTDTVTVTPVVHAPLEHATMAIAGGVRTAGQLQQEKSNADVSTASSASSSPPYSTVTSAASSAPSSLPTSGQTTPQRGSLLSAPSDISSIASIDQASPSNSHSRQVSTSSSPGEGSDYIHYDQRSLEGFLSVTIHNALNLPAHHRDGTVSAYVKLTLGKTKVHTAVVTSAQPAWEKTFRLPLHAQDAVSPHDTALKIRVKRHKKGSWLFGNEVIGDADLVLTQLKEEGRGGAGGFKGLTDIAMDHHEFTLIDPKTNHPQGSVILSCSFEPAAVNLGVPPATAAG